MSAKRGNRGLKGRLLNNSIDAYVLSLETINRLSVKYRTESFAFLICNAWELLLKAKVIEDAGNRSAIFYPKTKGERLRSLALRGCVERVFPNENDPTRRNVERIADLRDECVHLVISAVPNDVMGLFQACVLNYHKSLVDWFGISLSTRVPLGMMTLVHDLSPDQQDMGSSVLRRRLGSDAAKYLMNLQAEIRQEFDALGKPSEFSIGIDYRLAVVKDGETSDIRMIAGEGGAPASIVEVPKDPSRTHPHRRKEVYEEVNRRLDGAARVNAHDIRCVVDVYRIKKRPEFYYKGTVPGSPTQYSTAFVDWLVKQYANKATFFLDTRDKARQLSRKD